MKKLLSTILLNTLAIGVYANNTQTSPQDSGNPPTITYIQNNSANNITNPVFKKLFTSSGTTYSREYAIIDALTNNSLEVGRVYIGGKLQEIPSYESNTAGKNAGSQSQLLLNSNLGAISRMSDWVTGLVAMKGKNGTISPDNSYILINNGKSPIFAVAGYKYVDFGNMPRYSNDLQPVIRTFWIQGVTQAEAGYKSDNFNAQATIFNGSTGTNTNSDQISNNAVNLFYNINLGNDSTIKFGGAYLNALPQNAKLFNGDQVTLTSNQRTGAVDGFINPTISLGNAGVLDFNFEYAQALRTYQGKNTAT